MKKMLLPSIALGSVMALCGTLLPLAEVVAEEVSVIEEGKTLAFDRKKGNCLACHRIEGGTAPGNIGPPLITMGKRFPDKAKLRAQIYDASEANPNTMMPPFGRHQILTDQEIDKIVEFIHTL